MASPPATWSVTACLTYRGGLEIRAAAKNVLPGWGHGGERLSFLLRLRRRLRLAVTSQCGRAPAPADPDKKPRGLRLLRSLRTGLPCIWRRKKPPRAAAAMPGSRSQAIPSLLKDRALMRPATTVALCSVAALAVAAASVAALRLVAGFLTPSASCVSWRCFLAKKFVRFLGPPLLEWISEISLKLVDPPALGEWLGLPKLGLKWLFNK
ncbi:hypothetical protein CFC21_046117 [Triticum aestivum]|uniref:Uncharacterized protein n=3 Tax=Triticinae TaxID=1648030 RepID=A0A453E3P8_AEGTS|nr:uncharacterized protein LOC109777295 [Aegilops tauschii subsp. strangulata]XP_044352958.1 uncharacterized protein LOC123074078 [Triticum aestivum]KAF7035200.1 hypothetical protein CFC21_046117 [Triticum aestivum]